MKIAATSETTYQEPSIQVDRESEVTPPVPAKKKRGRPAKTNAAAPVVKVKAVELVTEDDIKLMSEIEAECPYPKDEFGQYGMNGTGWCNDEFAKRKQAGTKKAEQTSEKEFTAEAKQSDKRIDKALTRGSESFFEAVKELIISQENGYYKALGFKSFTAYKDTKSQYSRSYIGQGIQAYKALHSRIPDDKLISIPIPTAILLTKIPESKLTDEVINAAVSMKIQDFKEQEFPKHASQLVDATTGEAQTIVTEEYSWIQKMRVHQQVAGVWKKMMEVAKWKAQGLQDDQDAYGNFTIEEKALLCIYFECCKASGWEVEFDEANAAKPTDEEPAF